LLKINGKFFKFDFLLQNGITSILLTKYLEGIAPMDLFAPLRDSEATALSSMLRAIALLGVITMLPACSNRAIYDSLQRANLQECEQQPISQIQACMESNSISYDEYRRELERLAIEQQRSN